MALKKILIIEDDEGLCQMIAQVLRENGYSVKSTSSSLDGRGLADKHYFDIAIVDYKMPGLNGVDMLRIIKVKNPNTKVFIMTGRPFIEKVLEEEKVAHLVDGIIKKPFEEKDLLDRLTGSPF